MIWCANSSVKYLENYYNRLWRHPVGEIIEQKYILIYFKLVFCAKFYSTHDSDNKNIMDYFNKDGNNELVFVKISLLCKL